MFDIGWSEFVLIAVVALIAIGPKELPGVLRMVGQWMGKARKMAAEFQSQFQEAMREAEMADLKKSFDEVREAASGFSPAGMISSLIGDLILSFVLWHFVTWAGATTWAMGAFIGFLCWLGFFAASNFPQGIYEKRPIALFLINNGYWLVGLLITGGLLAVWR